MTLETRVADLERRVTALEGNTGPVPATPPHIDLDSDATQPLIDWLKTMEPGTVADLRDRPYRIDRSLTLDGLSGLTIRNATFRVTNPASELDHKGRSQRRHVWLRRCTDIRFENLSVVGQNTTNDAGEPIDQDGQALYDPKREFEHAICVEDSTNVTIDGFTADAVFGDGAYFRRSPGARLSNFRISRNGRQGIAVISGSHIKILDGVVTYSRRSGIDLEPNVSSEVMTDVEIGNVYLKSRLIPITCGGPGTIVGVHIHDVTSAGNTVPQFSLVPNSGGRRDNYTVERWTYEGVDVGSSVSPVRATNADNLQITDMTIPCRPGRDMTAFWLTNVGRVELTRCHFSGAVKLVGVTEPSDNHELTVVDCTPTA